MGLVKIIGGVEFFARPELLSPGGSNGDDAGRVNADVSEIIAAVRAEGDAGVRRYALKFEKAVPEKFEVPFSAARESWESLKSSEPRLASALAFAARNIRRFSELQKEQFRDFEFEILPGLFTGQRIIPVERAAVYVPSGRFPLISSALMGLIPAAVAGVGELLLVSPPSGDGLPDRKILAAAYLAWLEAGRPSLRIFAVGGAQAVAALALGTETIPRADLIVGPGNKYVAAAKRILFGEVGIDFIAGPTDVLVISDGGKGDAGETADLIAADMLAQAEHDPDARARALVPSRIMAERIGAALEKRLARLPTAETARASLEAGGLIIIYGSKEEALAAANRIAPEHLELQVSSPEEWIPFLKNYGSLFAGSAAAEALGDYSAGINHTLPTSGSARFTGGLSVRNFLKTVTSLRCASGEGYAQALEAAELIGRAEGLAGHAESAAVRIAHNSLPG